MATKFDIDEIDMGYGEERWVTYGRERRFIARFKHHRPGANSRAFVKFLVEHFTVEEYFHALEVEKKTPGAILREKGHISPNERSAAEARQREEKRKAMLATPMILVHIDQA